MVKKIEWTPQLVNAFWNGVAQTELDSLSFGRVAGPRFLELFGDYFVPGSRCLDFGAGSGHVLQLLLDRGLDVAGFDPAPDRQQLLLKSIGQRKNFLGIKGLDSDEQFDIVLLMEVVEHVLEEDFVAVLDRVSRFVKPGGLVIASTPNNENLALASVYCPVSETLFHPWQHVRSFTPGRLSDLFRDLGFSSQFLALVDFSYNAEAIDIAKHWSPRNLAGPIEAFRKHAEELDRITLALQGHGEREIWFRVARRLKLLFQHHALIVKLHAMAYDMSRRFDEITRTWLQQLERARTAAPTNKGKDGVDLRLGNESTIVYVGRKTRTRGPEKANTGV